MKRTKRAEQNASWGAKDELETNILHPVSDPVTEEGIFQGHAPAAWVATVCAKCYSVSPVCTQSMLSEMFPSLRSWTKFSSSSPRKRYSRLLFLLLRSSRTEQRGADTAPQPDLYSGQAVHYIKQETGFCKSTCPTFLPNSLKPSTTSGRQISVAVGKRWRSRRTNSDARWMIQRLRLSLCSSIYSADIAAQFLVPHLFDITCITCWNI